MTQTDRLLWCGVLLGAMYYQVWQLMPLALAPLSAAVTAVVIVLTGRWLDRERRTL